MEIQTNYFQINNNSNYTLCEKNEDILPFMNLFLIVFGTCGNFLTLFILTRKNVRKHSYMRYLLSLCIIDTLCLYTWNFSLVYSYFNIRKIEHEGEIYCRVFSFFSYFILQSSSWVICSIGMDRIITIIFRKKSNFISVINNHSFIIVIFVVILISLFNSVVLINNAESVKLNVIKSKTLSSYSCYEPKSFYFIWDIVHIFMYSLLPFFILIFENITLYLISLNHEKKINLHCKSMSYQTNRIECLPNLSESKFIISRKDKLMMKFDKKKRVYRKNVNIQKMNFYSNKYPIVNFNKKKSVGLKKNTKGLDVANLLIFLNISFIITTLPYSSFYALKLNFFFNENYKKIIIGILTFLQYTRHSGNFLIYLITSSIIKNEIKKIYRKFVKKC